MWIERLPAVNAALNTAGAALLVLGFRHIRRGRVGAHRACMLGAVLVSTLFLASYLVYHWTVGSVRFPGGGRLRTFYLALLASHSMLAAVVPALVLVTVIRAARGRVAAHRKIARWTLPVWLYVSVTGVVVYWLLYQVAGARALLPSR